MEPSTLQRVSGSPNAARYLFASLFALVLTAALLVLMTRLILPFDDDPVVSETHQRLEFQRLIVPYEEEVLRRSVAPDRDEIPEIVVGEARRPDATLPAGSVVDSNGEHSEAAEPIDLEATAKTVIENMEGRKYREWLATQANKQKYVSIMQGPIPGSSQPPQSQPSSSNGNSYRNTYGETEVEVNENCVMQLRSTAFDYSDFATKLPARISCRPPAPEIDLTGLERYVRPLEALPPDEPAARDIE